MRGSWSGGSFTGDPTDMLSKALEIGDCFNRCPSLGNMERRSSPKVLERKGNFLNLGNFL